MATNSLIGIFEDNFRVRWRNCVYDGYVLGVGRYLLQIFDTPDLAKRAVDVGSGTSISDVPIQEVTEETSYSIRSDTLAGMLKVRMEWEYVYLRETAESVQEVLSNNRLPIVDKKIYENNPNGFWVVSKPLEEEFKYLKDAYIEEFKKQYASEKTVWDKLVGDNVNKILGFTHHNERYRLLEIWHEYQKFFKNFDMKISEMNLLSTMEKINEFFNKYKQEIEEIYLKLYKELKDISEEAI